MITQRIRLDPSLPLFQQAHKGHNRWHPDIAPIVRIAPGSVVELDTLDGLDGQIGPQTKNDDLASIDLGRVHPMTGPVYVEGAEPGDLLAVKIEAITTAERGFTCVMPGFGFLRDLFPKPFVVHWEMRDGFARSNELPSIKIPGAPFMGVMGVAPSHELLQRIVAREADLAHRGGMVMPPEPAGALPEDHAIAAAAFRTIAPHENGGNMDIKQITSGSTLYLPVYVPGALFSVGDAHFAQGDGESCGTAVETTGTLVARFDLLKGEARRRKQTDPSYETEIPRSERAAARRFYATTGICTRKSGRSESEDLTLAARNALMNMLDHLCDAYGYSQEQAYCLASVAVDLNVSQVVDVPNFIISACLPLDIFDR